MRQLWSKVTGRKDVRCTRLRSPSSSTTEPSRCAYVTRSIQSPFSCANRSIGQSAAATRRFAAKFPVIFTTKKMRGRELFAGQRHWQPIHLPRQSGFFPVLPFVSAQLRVLAALLLRCAPPVLVPPTLSGSARKASPCLRGRAYSRVSPQRRRAERGETHESRNCDRLPRC